MTTKEITTGNNFLANGRTELNTTSNLYDLDFRNYDPALGRMYGVDPMASKYSSLTPYNYSFNNPIGFNDPTGADPPSNYFYNGAGAYGYPGYTYDDVVPPTARGDYNCAMCWRENQAGALANYGAIAGYSGGGMGMGWRPGDGRIFWSSFESLYRDARSVHDGSMSHEAYAGKYGTSYGGGVSGLTNALASLMPNQIFNPWAGRQLSDGRYVGAWQTYSSTIVDLINREGYKLRTRYSKNSTTTKVPLNRAYDNFIGIMKKEFKDISDQQNYPGIKIYEHANMRGGITLPGIGIIVGPGSIGKFRTMLLQHEYGHFLDSQFSGDLINPSIPNSTVNFYLMIGIPSLFNAATGIGGIHDDFWTETRANDWAKAWFGSSLHPEFEFYYPTSKTGQ